MTFLIRIGIFSCRSDTQAEIDLVKRIAIENGAFDAVMADHWAKGRRE
jgi:formyltetrahydrofolate synthetase